MKLKKLKVLGIHFKSELLQIYKKQESGSNTEILLFFLIVSGFLIVGNYSNYPIKTTP